MAESAHSSPPGNNEPRATAGGASADAESPSTLVTARTWGDVTEPKRVTVPAGLWTRCPSCEAMLYQKTVEQNLFVCPDCQFHFRISAGERARQLCDQDSFEPMWDKLAAVDMLGFTDVKPYKDRLVSEQKKTRRPDAVVAGSGYIKGRRIVLACLDGQFMMGSMGCVVGEVVTRAIELATKENLPLVVVSCSGGARMQEGALSLMQMAKTSAALARLDAAGGLFISLLTDPTTGGVTASFAMLGDVIFAEPGALIGFAGPRVIANTVRQELPEGFQRSEHLLKKGFVDRVVHRHELRSEISRIIDFAGK
ncbi:MAG: acetyl-CoA carboxylase carboxyltransferase subunit beta [Phycisphaeraceae bacterium]|nr:acetyl-CoA carboxylase carboxyltransferase subunit beta [Phycisphaeraceae bacterium]